MVRLIDADALHDALRAKQKWIVWNDDKHNEGYTYDQVHFAIDDAPTVDLVKHGHWVKNGDRYCECSVCHHEGNISGQDNYCWFCGAKMETEDMME